MANETFLEHVKAWFTTLKSKVSNLFNAGVDAIEVAVTENEGKIEGDLLTFLETTVDDAVKTAATVDGDWTAKLVAAVTKVGEDVATAGLTLGKNEIVLLVVSGYTRFKATLADNATQAIGNN